MFKYKKLLSLGFIISILGIGSQSFINTVNSKRDIEVIEYTPIITKDQGVELNFEKKKEGPIVEVKFDVGYRILDVDKIISDKWNVATPEKNSLEVEYTYISTRRHGINCSFEWSVYKDETLVYENGEFKNWNVTREGWCPPSSSGLYTSVIEYRYSGFEGTEVIYKFKTANAEDSSTIGYDALLDDTLADPVKVYGWTELEPLFIEIDNTTEQPSGLINSTVYMPPDPGSSDGVLKVYYSLELGSTDFAKITLYINNVFFSTEKLVISEINGTILFSYIYEGEFTLIMEDQYGNFLDAYIFDPTINNYYEI